jgi:hypothetical protein
VPLCWTVHWGLPGGGICAILMGSDTPQPMSTRSRIGYELPDHSVVSVYCHHDGYVEHNGRILVEHYQNRDDVQDLIDGGSMSSLRIDTLWNSKAKRDENNEIVTDKNGRYIYEPTRDPQPLYHTERGEELEVDHTSFDEFVSGKMCGEEYAYLFDLNGNWKAYKIGWGPVERVQIPNYVTAA